MAARPRKRRTDLPEHLYYDARRGSYRLRLIDGRSPTIGHDRQEAIAIAREYNLRARTGITLTVDQLLGVAPMPPANSTGLGADIQRLVERIEREERPAKDARDTMRNDAARAAEFFAATRWDEIDVSHVTAYIAEYHGAAGPNVQNRKVAWLKKLFDYAMDEGLMKDNPAARKKRRRLHEKQRERLRPEWYRAIHAQAPLWLQTAMDLSLQSTHARLEICRIQYSIKLADLRRPLTCGCIWLAEPQQTPAGLRFGTLYIHRQKIQKKEAAHVAIPIGAALKAIIDRSRDAVISRYVVHRMPDRKNAALSAEVDHLTQLAPDYISRAFSDVRDKVGCCEHLPLKQRPTFHEIRALAAHQITLAGDDPQARMAHTDAKSTRIYTQNHINWVEVPLLDVELKA